MYRAYKQQEQNMEESESTVPPIEEDEQVNKETDEPEKKRIKLETLPDEMLANIMRYTDFATIHRLSKISKRIDELAKRMKLRDILPVQKFEISFGSDKEGYVRLYLSDDVAKDIGCDNPVQLYTYDTKPTKIAFSFWFSIVKVEHTILIKGGDERLDDRAISSFIEHAENLNKVVTLKFERTKILLSKEVSVQLMTYVFPNVENIEMLRGQVDTGFINSEVFGNREWNRLLLNSQMLDGHFLEDDFLLEVVANSKLAMLSALNNRYHIESLPDLIRNLMRDGKYSSLVDLGRLQLRHLDVEEIRDIFIVEFYPDVFVYIDMHYNVKITFSDCRYAPYLRFSV